jgi:hypothetical protein
VLPNQIPIHSMLGKTSNVAHLQVFGCKLFFNTWKVGKGKVDQVGEECMVMWYAEQSLT